MREMIDIGEKSLKPPRIIRLKNNCDNGFVHVAKRVKTDCCAVQGTSGWA